MLYHQNWLKPFVDSTFRGTSKEKEKKYFFTKGWKNGWKVNKWVFIFKK